jgi:high-affinity nickel permease
MDALAVMGLALGMRHGTDPDHLAAIDGLALLVWMFNGNQIAAKCSEPR